MNKYIYIACLLIFFTDIKAQRNLLENKSSIQLLNQYAGNLSQWQEAQKLNYLKKIDALPDSVKNKIIEDAEKLMTYEWPSLSASLYLDYRITGARSNYEQKNNERLKAFNQLVAAELISRNKKYIPQIVNGLWALLEQSTWVLPAHSNLQRDKSGLPDPTEEIIDLGDGIVSSEIQATQFMLRKDFDEYSTVVNKRIDAELKKRVFNPYLARNDYWWMGFNKQPVNNWNAWINRNVLYATLLSNLRADSVTMIVEKVIRCADNFINQYPDDGGCDEGSSYWSEAGGAIIKLIHLLSSFTHGAIDLGSDTLIHNMGTYICKFHIKDDNFVNFADAHRKTIPNPVSVYRFGEICHDESLKNFAAYLFKLQKNRLDAVNIPDFLETASIYEHLVSLHPAAPLPAVSWLPNRELLSARTKAGSSEGLFLAVQGGNNGESHNHNDVGNFILYVNGDPFIIDAGVGTYTSKTFSSERYSIWTMQSQWHNCPEINGVPQSGGSQFKASDILFTEKKNNIELLMNLASAYPPEAAVKSWKRKFLFQPLQGTFSISEHYELKSWKAPFIINFLCYASVQDKKNGTIELKQANSDSTLILQYNPSLFEVKIETKIIDDKSLIKEWGASLTRISLVSKTNTLNGSFETKFYLSK